MPTILTRFLPPVLLLASQQGIAGDFAVDLFNQAASRASQGRLADLERVVRAPSGTTGTAAPATSGRASLDNGLTFYAGYIADYWQQPDAPNRGDDASSDARGHVIRKPVFGGNPKQAGVPEMRRKLERILPRVLEHPALKEIRGASLAPGGGFYRERGGPMGPAVAAHLSLIAYPINLEDSKTRRFPDGTYHTPGEGAVLNVEINDTDLLEGRLPIGTYQGMPLLRRGSGYMLLVANTDRPFFVEQGGRMALNPELIDPSRPRADIQFMTVYVGAASYTWSDIAHRKEKATSPTGRLLGVMFNTDWAGLLREVN